MSTVISKIVSKIASKIDSQSMHNQYGYIR